MKNLVAAVACAVLAFAAPAQARRVALVIGNAAYQGTAQLTNTVRDAATIAKLLGPDGFKFDDVTLVSDAKGPVMQMALTSFAEKARGADIAIVYLSGFSNASVERSFDISQGETALLGIEAGAPDQIDTEAKLRAASLSDRQIADALAKAAPRLALVLIDTMRANPPSGLRQSSTPRSDPGTVGKNALFIYASEPGQAADDGPPDGNGPLVAALLRHALAPGRTLQELYALMSVDVAEASEGRQRLSRIKTGDWSATLVASNHR